MMAKPSPAVMDFMSKYSVDSDEVWQVPDGAWVIRHKALERVAAKQGITFDMPQIATRIFETEGVSLLVVGRLGERMEWTFGEASSFNLTRKSEKRPLYPWAMAEKRAKDRVILKLLSASGELFSEEESDDFRQKETISGEPAPSEDIIGRVDGIEVLTVDAQRVIFSELEREIYSNETVEELKRWKVTAKTRASRLSSHWREDLNARYLDHLRALEMRDALEYQERATA